MPRKFFYATTSKCPIDNFEIVNKHSLDRDLKMDANFGIKRELVVHSKLNPWLSLEGQVFPPNTAMIACWAEVKPGIIEIGSDVRFLIGDLSNDTCALRRANSNRVVLADGRVLRLSDDQLASVCILHPPTVVREI